MRLKNVRKCYGDTVALDGIDLTLERGKITAVLGESGAGKTTLLNVLARTTDFEGTLEGEMPPSYLFQDPILLPHLTVEGNLKLVLPKEKWQEIDPMLQKVGLGGMGKRYSAKLSGGERQRAAIARAFLFPHELLLMDEPFSSLDLALKDSLLKLVAELWERRGSTIVFVTHDVHEAVLLAHRAVVLKKGRIAADFEIAGAVPRDFFGHLPVEDALVRVLMGAESGDRGP